MKSILFTALLLFAITSAKANCPPLMENLDGIPAETSERLSTLAMSFSDMTEPLFSIKLKILTEFVKHTPKPKLVLIVASNHHSKLNDTLENLNLNKTQVKLLPVQDSFWFKSPWIRDFAPVMVKLKNGKYKAVSFNYTDDSSEYASQKLAIEHALGFKSAVNVDLKLLPGEITADESDRLFVSETVLENNQKSKNEIEKLLMDHLLPSEIVWMPRLPRDIESTGHGDMAFKLLKNNKAIVAQSRDSRAKRILDQMAALLQSKGYEVSRLMAGSRKNRFNGNPVFLSYTNSIIVGDSVFVPQFNRKSDGEALALYKKLGYSVIFFDGTSMDFGGAEHCLTYLYP